MVTLQAAMMAMLLSNPGQVELLDFHADWCAPCRAMQPTIEALEAKGYPIRKVNISRERELAAQYGVQSVPCYVMLVDGKEVERVSGGTSFSRLEKMFKTAGFGRDPAANQNPRAFAANDAPARHPAAAAAAASLPPAGAFHDPHVSPANAALPPAGNFNPPSAPTGGPISDARLIAASVRIRVADPTGNSCGSGTIIDARGGKALVLTCGHIFRDSKGRGKIEIELFGPHAGKKVEGRLESYDADERDVGLVSMQMPEPIAAARLAPVGYAVRQGDAVASVGCDHGADPTVRRNRVNASNAANLWIDDQPTEGRSGGGLFSAEGYAIGVCNGCDPRDREGLYAPMGRICAELDKAGLSFVYQSPQGWENTTAGQPSILLASNAVPSMPAAMPDMNASINAAAGSAENFAGGGPLAAPPLTADSSAGMSAGERAALEEIRRHLKDGAEVVCVIRPRNVLGAKSEVIMLDKASPELVRQLSAISQAKDGVQRTSLEVARPRKKILEWSISDRAISTAP
ncbi:MAG: trypsin-like peptidase domain-containing protein [Pirellulales bacterium]|nr:trypsin-like peptidase domain-containing protein [Pirellulales bacterium]